MRISELDMGEKVGRVKEWEEAIDLYNMEIYVENQTDKEEERGEDCRKTFEEINAQKEIIFKAINIHYNFISTWLNSFSLDEVLNKKRSERNK